MKEFAYKDIDEEGLKTLETLADAHRFNRWMYETIAPHLLPGSLLEVGSGIGNISKFFLQAGRPIMQSDLRDRYCQYLQRTYGSHPMCQDVVQLDLVHPGFEQAYASLLGQFDNLYALNVIEHIRADGLALANCRKLLRPGGRLIILVPAFPWLYNRFDEELHHYRRYTAAGLARRFEEQGLTVTDRFYFNFVGMAGWFVSGKLLRHRIIPEGQMKLYNRLVPLFRPLDTVFRGMAGLSVVVVGDRT